MLLTFLACDLSKLSGVHLWPLITCYGLECQHELWAVQTDPGFYFLGFCRYNKFILDQFSVKKWNTDLSWLTQTIQLSTVVWHKHNGSRWQLKNTQLELLIAPFCHSSAGRNFHIIRVAKPWKLLWHKEFKAAGPGSCHASLKQAFWCSVPMTDELRLITRRVIKAVMDNFSTFYPPSVYLWQYCWYYCHKHRVTAILSKVKNSCKNPNWPRNLDISAMEKKHTSAREQNFDTTVALFIEWIPPAFSFAL